MGLNNGEVILFTKESTKKHQPHTTSSARYFFQGKNQTHDKPSELTKKKREDAYSHYLRQFKFSEALDAALASNNEQTIMTIMREILYRGGMKIALSNRDETTLEPLMTFLINALPNPNNTKILVEIITEVMEVYTKDLGKSVVIDDMFFKMQQRLEKEIELNKSMQELLGEIDLIIGAADCARNKSD